jgi:TonB family protein
VQRRLVGLLIVLSLSLSLPLGARQREEPVYEPGNGVTLPKLIRTVHVQYTANAMRKKLKGRVRMIGVVTREGIPTQIEVTEHLDDEMDAECVKAFEQWRFEPGKKDGDPSPFESGSR